MNRSRTSIFRLAIALCGVTLSTQGHHASADAPLPTAFVNVLDYMPAPDPSNPDGVGADVWIHEAMAAAALTTHKTVYFPNGTYAIRSGLNLNRGVDTQLHLIGESRDGVLLVPDVEYLSKPEVYNNGDWQAAGAARVAHMINLDASNPFDNVDVSVQNMTIDMRHEYVMGTVPGDQDRTYNVVGHGVRIGEGWKQGQFTVNEVTIRNVGSYGVGIQDRDGHSKNNVTLSNLNIERTGSDGIDTKEASGDGNRNLVIRNVNINEVGYLDTGAAPAIDIRYREFTIENVNLVSTAHKSTLPNQRSNSPGIYVRPVNNIDGGVIEGSITDAYLRGFTSSVIIHSRDGVPHANIDVSDFYAQGQESSAIQIINDDHSGHTFTDGLIDPAFGSATNTGGQATLTNVVVGRRDPALTPTTDTTFEDHVALTGQVFSPAWEGIVGTERVGLNPTSPVAGPFVFDVSSTGVMQIDFDTTYNVMDQLIVDGTLNLAGELRVNTIGGTATQAGDFKIFDAANLTGAFDTITLPAAGTGLAWRTDDLASNGIISLITANTILLGDTDDFSYNSNDPDDNPPVDAAFLASVQSQWPNFTPRDLDQGGNSSIRAMTFTFAPLDPNTLESVWLEIRVDPLSGFSSDQMVLDSLDRIISLSNLIGYDGDSSDPQTLRYELLPSEFALLADGQLNVALQDDAIVDWVALSWTQIPEPTSFALLLPGALLVARGRRRRRRE